MSIIEEFEELDKQEKAIKVKEEESKAAENAKVDLISQDDIICFGVPYKRTSQTAKPRKKKVVLEEQKESNANEINHAKVTLQKEKKAMFEEPS